MKVLVLTLCSFVSVAQVAAFALSAAHPGRNVETTYYDLAEPFRGAAVSVLGASPGSHLAILANGVDKFGFFRRNELRVKLRRFPGLPLKVCVVPDSFHDFHNRALQVHSPHNSGPTCFLSHGLSSSEGGHRIATAGAINVEPTNCGGHFFSAAAELEASTAFRAEYIGTPHSFPRSFVKIWNVAIASRYPIARTPSRSTFEIVERSAST